jgi:glycosyltransferase involved in cell wall biosynthesis
MNILFDATVLEIPFTGIAKSTLLLYQKCYELNSNIIINGFLKKQPFSDLPENIKIHRLRDYFYRNLYSKNSISRTINRFNPDIIHFPWNGNIPSVFKNTKTVMTLHDVLPLEIPNYFGNDTNKQLYITKTQNDLERCDIVFTDSFYSKKQIENNFHIKNEIKVNYLAPTMSQRMDMTFKKPDFEYFVYVGGYDQRKGLDALIKAYFRLYESNKTSCKLIFTGKPGPISADFQRLIEKGRTLGIIEERGYVSDNELSHLISNSVCLLYLSKYEGFGLPPLDAMNLGCPVITTKYSSIPEICGDAALYVEPDNIEEVCEKMSLLEDKKDLRNVLKQKGILQASSFTWEKTARLFLDTISQAGKI